MTQNYYFKIPMYLIEGNDPQTMSITMSGLEVATAVISSTDLNNPNYVEFSVETEFGIYEMVISIVDSRPNEEDVWTNVSIEDIWMSIDNQNWISAIVNRIAADFGAVPYKFFNPAKGGRLVAQDRMTTMLNLYSKEDWDKNYKPFSYIFRDSTNEELLERLKSPEIVADWKLAKELLTARGYK